MSAKSTTKRNRPAERGNGNPLETAGKVDEIREIIFGGQMRDYDQRFRRLDESVHQQLDTIRAETASQFEALEKFIKAELAALSERLAAEQAERSAALKDTTREIRKLETGLEKNVGKLSEDLAKRESRLREQLREQGKSLSADIRKRYEDLQQAQQRDTDALQDVKLDRQTLAELLTEVAIRVQAESPETD